MSHMSGKFGGSGIFLLDFYKNIPHVILFHSSYSNVYHDLGGRIECRLKHSHQNCLIETAIRETLEESRNFIYVQNINTIRKLQYVDVKKKQKYFRSYILQLAKPFSETKYLHNVHVLDKTNLPFCWKETDHVSRFSLIDLLNMKNGVCYDIHGKLCVIHPRTISIIRQFSQINLRLNVFYPNEFINKQMFGTFSWII